MKRCQNCDEEVRENAIKCKHCGSMLRDIDTDTLDRAVTLGSTDSEPQYDTLDVAATQGTEATILAGQYRVIKKIGEGGMGVVYLAEDIEMRNRPVAIKVLPPLLAKNRRAVENLRGEAITAIKLSHPNIVRLYGFHSDGDIKFLVMEYIDGVTLEEKIFSNPSKKLGIDETIKITEEIAKALDYAHSQSPPVVHRDLKSSNVMIDKNCNVKVLDFGIAREIHDSYTTITGKGDTSGTLPYMSPEQVRGQRPVPSMDIYSLGIICYECLKGKVPFYTGQIDYQIIHEKPVLIDGIPDYTNNALQKVLAKEPSKRPNTANEFIKLTKKKIPPISEGKSTVAIAPFDTEKAKDYQKRTAEFLGLQVAKTVNLTDVVNMEFVLIPSGEFEMGSPSSEEGHKSDEGPIHRIKLTTPFYMSKYEVTKEQWLAVMSRSQEFGRRDLPVTGVTWSGATEFCKELSRKKQMYFRLATEAEWEFACRAGTQTPFYFGYDLTKKQANFGGSLCGGPNSVGSYESNAFGLYDMHGNVWEWCQDWYSENYYNSSPTIDPVGPAKGVSCVIRGGSYCNPSEECRSASRYGVVLQNAYNWLGFRLVLCLEK